MLCGLLKIIMIEKQHASKTDIRREKEREERAGRRKEERTLGLDYFFLY